MTECFLKDTNNQYATFCESGLSSLGGILSVLYVGMMEGKSQQLVSFPAVLLCDICKLL